MTLLSFCCLTYFASSQNLDSEIDKLYQVKNNKPGFSVAVFKGDKIRSSLVDLEFCLYYGVLD